MNAILRGSFSVLLAVLCALSVWLPNASVVGISATLPPTRTPGPAAQCPQATGRAASVSGDFIDSGGIQPLATPLLNYLNTRGSPDGLRAALHTRSEMDKIQINIADVTGDRVPEVLIALSFKDVQEILLFILGCQQGQYASLYSTLYTDAGQQSGLTPFGIRAVRDMNGDGVADVVYSFEPNIGAHDYGTRYFAILEWDGSHFTQLAPPSNKDDPTAISDAAAASDTIRDHGDGTAELVIVHQPDKESYYGGSITERRKEVIFAWNGFGFAWYCERALTPAQYRVQAVLDGDNESRCGRYDRALLSYQSVIFDSNLLPWTNVESDEYGALTTPETPFANPDERTIMEAYARYRIVLLHAVAGQQREAQVDTNILQQKFASGTNEHPIVELATAFWQVYSQGHNLAAACQQAITYADAHAELTALFAPYQYYSQGYPTRQVFRFVPDNATQAIETSDICPFK